LGRPVPTGVRSCGLGALAARTPQLIVRSSALELQKRHNHDSPRGAAARCRTWVAAAVHRRHREGTWPEAGVGQCSRVASLIRSERWMLRLAPAA
jgi:hypothetical protein